MKVRGMKLSIFAADMRVARELEQALWSYGDSLEEELSIRAFTQPQVFVKDCQKTPPDALFFVLPDSPPGKIALLERFQVDFPQALLIVVGKEKEYALNAFQLGAIYYLMPPYSWKELERCYQRCVKVFAKAPASLKLSKNRKIYALPLTNLLYIKVQGKQTCFYLNGQEEPFTTNYPLSAVLKQLRDPRFLRCYRNCIVNMYYVQEIQLKKVLLQNGTLLPLTRHNYAQLVRTYHNYMLSHSHASKNPAADLLHYKERLHKN